MIHRVVTLGQVYRDSIALMQLSATLAALPGVSGASAVMGTPANLALLADSGLTDSEMAPAPDALLLAIAADDEGAIDAAIGRARAALDGGARDAADAGRTAGPATPSPRSISMAQAASPDAGLALISTPGEYAAAEARKALALGLDVMVFSDNVALSDEVHLKSLAAERSLIVMGPDCGSAIVDGVPLGFANQVRRGDVGVIAASGTGLQEVTCLVDRLGGGISHALGTGGRDLWSEVGGLTMLRCLDLLSADDATRVIVLVSKPPAPAVAATVMDAARRSGKPVIVCFLGSDTGSGPDAQVRAAPTLETAARLAVSSTGAPPAAFAAEVPAVQPAPAGRCYVRGLFSGGTFCYEALVLLGKALGVVHSPSPLDPRFRLEDPWRSHEHTVVDLGDDVFTRGRPHPMIDPRLRHERMLVEAADEAVAAILFDIVLGHGAHPDPAGEMVPVLVEAGEIAARSGRGLAFVASVCGTDDDPQCRSAQVAALRDAGVVVAPSNAAAAMAAAAVVSAS